MHDEAAALRRLALWFRRDALALWAARGYDHGRGGFFEALDFEGEPVAEAPRRVRVQARQIYVFASVARLGWSDKAEGPARAGFDFFLARACPEAGARGCVHVLTPAGEIEDARRDLYDQAFALLACAAVWRAFGDARALELAGRTIHFLDRELAASGGGYLEDDRGTRPRRQNPHMHLFEAFLALHGATGEAAWKKRADAVFALFERRFFDRKEGIAREFFTDDLEGFDAKQGDVIEPGHMLEWVWLLDKYRAGVGADAPEIEAALFANAIRLGRDPQSGFLVDRLRLGESAAGKTRRLWPQTEYLKACLARARVGDAGAATRAEDIASALFASYLGQKTPGLWCDKYDGAGRPIANDVPASILYHLFETAHEIETFFTEERR